MSEEMEQVIEIQQDELLDNLEHLIQNSRLFNLSSNINNVNVCVFYIENKELHNYKKYEVQINQNTLKKKELLTLILNNNKHYTKKYDLIGIYQYKFTLKPEELKNFASNQTSYNFIECHKKVQDVTYDPCIELFNSNNSLFLFFSKDSQKRTKKSQQQASSSPETQGEEDEIIQLNDKNKIQKTQRRVRFNLNKSMKTKA